MAYRILEGVVGFRSPSSVRVRTRLDWAAAAQPVGHSPVCRHLKGAELDPRTCELTPSSSGSSFLLPESTDGGSWDGVASRPAGRRLNGNNNVSKHYKYHKYHEYLMPTLTEVTTSQLS